MGKLLIAILAFPLFVGAFQISESKAEDPQFLEIFKSDSVCKRFFEPTSYLEGSHYAKDILYYYEDLLPHFVKFKENDSLGSPELSKYNRIGAISPTTLRWVKTAADIRSYFGSLSTFNILYIGAGYGGVCKILSDLGEWTNVTILDEKSVANLSRQYLNAFGILANFKTLEDPLNYEDFDLVIVDADFMTIPCDMDLLLKIASSIPRGIIIKRGIPDQFNSLIATLINKKREGKIKADLFWQENVRQQLYWKPSGEFRGKPLNEEVLLSASDGYQSGSAISAIVNSGRLGDHLVDYCSALWLARSEKLPFFYSPFKYSDSFALSAISEKRGHHFLYKKQKELKSNIKNPFNAESTLWLVPHRSIERFELQNFSSRAFKFFVDWGHPEFKEEVRKRLSPLTPIPLIFPPEGYLSVALHLRRGGAYTSDYQAYQILPLHFTPDSFMIEQLKRLADIFPNRPLYIYLFTDDLDPAALAKKMGEGLGSANAIFDFGKNGDLPADERVLSDFHSFKNFDCIIRPGSHFSFMGGLLGDFTLEISPSFCHMKKDGTFVYDQVQILFRGKGENVVE